MTNSLEWKKPRVWTSKEGKAFKGSMESAKSNSVRVIKDGKPFTVYLNDLSGEDVAFVKGFLKITPVSVSAKPRKWTNHKKGDRRTVEVKVNNVVGRELVVSIFWIGDDGNKDRYGVFKTESKKIRTDGELSFEVVYPGTRRWFDKNYRGFAVKVTCEGVRVGETASQKPYVRFLEKDMEAPKSSDFPESENAKGAESSDENGSLYDEPLLPKSTTYQMISCNDNRWAERNQLIICRYRANSNIKGKKLYLQIFVDSYKNSQTRGQVTIKNHKTGTVLKALKGLGRGSSPKIELGIDAVEDFEVSITNKSGDGLRIDYYNQEGDPSKDGRTPHILLTAE